MAARHPDLSQAIWRKSSYSSSTGQNCVEVATNLPGVVAVRDSRNLEGRAAHLPRQLAILYPSLEGLQPSLLTRKTRGAPDSFRSVHAP